MKRIIIRVFVVAFGALAANSALAWGNPGHEAVVAVAIQFDPTLRARIGAVMQSLPASVEWQALERTGLIPHNPYQTEKDDPEGWVRALATDPEKSATFPDWARDYNGYAKDAGGFPTPHYDRIHFYDLDYDDAANTRFVGQPNALTAFPALVQELRAGSPGTRAWALAWILHVVGDLHQPLHTTSRELPDRPGQSDQGGNKVGYGSQKLHTFWDHLPDSSVGGSPDHYAAGLVATIRQRPANERQGFQAKAKDLNLEDWTKEGRDAIVAIGYPSDGKVQDYHRVALTIAHQRILLAGARLANLLDQILPARPSLAAPILGGMTGTRMGSHVGTVRVRH